MLVCFVLFRTRGCGCSERPAFPAPSVSLGETVHAQLGRIAPRDRGVVFEIMLVIARSDRVRRSSQSEGGRCDANRHCERSEAIHLAAGKEWIASSLRSSQ